MDDRVVAPAARPPASRSRIREELARPFQPDNVVKRRLLRYRSDSAIASDEMAAMRRELDARGEVIEELDRAVAERTAWAERMVAEAELRGAVIAELQQALAERTA